MVIKKKNTYGMQIILLVILLMTGNLLAQPQHKQPPPMLPDSNQIIKLVDELTTELSLSEEQKSQVSELYFVHFKEVGELMEKNNEQGREAVDALKKEFEEQVKTLLSDEKKAQFDTFLKRRGPQHKRKTPQGRNLIEIQKNYK